MALHFASCVFEGERIYSGRIYRLEEHTERLFGSAALLGITIPYTEEEINRACYEAAKVQDIKDGYVRPVVFRGQRHDGGGRAERRRSMSRSRCGPGLPISTRQRS